jgi:hypothetical protein
MDPKQKGVNWYKMRSSVLLCIHRLGFMKCGILSWLLGDSELLMKYFSYLLSSLVAFLAQGAGIAQSVYRRATWLVLDSLGAKVAFD